MQILVTGKGFLAKHLINSLLSTSPDGRVLCANRSGGISPNTIKYKNDKYLDVYVPLDISPCVQDLFKYYKPDIVFHLAASQGKTDENFENNVGATHNLLKHIPSEARFVYASSSTVYGDLAQKGVACHEECPMIPTNLYGASKASSESLIWAYSTAKILKSLILRFPAIVGKGVTHGALRDIVKKTQSNDVVKLFGQSPGSLKPYLYVKDAVDAILYLVNNNHTGIYNVSPDDGITIQEMAAAVQNCLGVQKELKWVDNPIQGDNNLVKLDNSKLLQVYNGLKYKTSIEAVKEAIGDIVNG